MACAATFNVGLSLYSGSSMLWVDVFFALFWVYMARRAIKREQDPDEIDVALTQDQKDKLKKASDILHTVMDEVESEVKAEALAMRLKAKEKARVQSNNREDKEAGKEGAD
jgi:hypothetical protein